MATTPGDLRIFPGRRVVITRAPEQSAELIGLLKQCGAEVILLPMVRFLEPVDTAHLDAAIGALGSFDWVVFTSGNGVKFFLDRCRHLGAWPVPKTVKVAVVGQATRDALSEEGLRASQVPREFGGVALVRELSTHIVGKKVLLPRSDIAGAELPAGLRAAGATVTEVVAYRTVEPEPASSAESVESLAPEPAARVAALAARAAQAGDADAIAFFSPSAFHHFRRMFGAEAVSRMQARVAFVAVGPVTAAAIREAGVPVAVEAPRATAESLVAALAAYFGGQAVQKERS